MCSSQENNWALNFEPSEFMRMRKLMIQCILATDMARHMAEIGQWKNRSMIEDYDPADRDKLLVLRMAFHMADISGSTKQFKLTRLWADLLFVEFFAQGDLERQHGFEISMMMDRNTTNIAKG